MEQHKIQKTILSKVFVSDLGVKTNTSVLTESRDLTIAIQIQHFTPTIFGVEYDYMRVQLGH